MPIRTPPLFPRSTQEKASKDTASGTRGTVSKRRSGEPKPSSLSKPQESESDSSTFEASSSQPPARTKFKGIGFDCFRTAKDRGLPKPSKQADLWQQEAQEESAPAPSSTHADEPSREDRAAALITRHMRAHIAKRAHVHMTLNGNAWKGGKERLLEECKLEPHEFANIVTKLSSVNMSALRQGLGKLTESEAAFFDRFTQQEFFATHFTNAKLDHASTRSSSTPTAFRRLWRPSDNGGRVLSIYSCEKLEKRGIEYNFRNTSLFDHLFKAESDFVYFALECGKKPMKRESRFGKTLYRVPLRSPVFDQCSWGTLDDFVVDTPEKEAQAHRAGLSRHLPNLSPDELDVIDDRCCRKTRDPEYNTVDAFSDVFAGKDLIPGAALSIISALRKLPQDQQQLSERLLASSTPKEINGLLNAVFRPEIRVPIHFFTTDFQKYTRWGFK